VADAVSSLATNLGKVLGPIRELTANGFLSVLIQFDQEPLRVHVEEARMALLRIRIMLVVVDGNRFILGLNPSFRHWSFAETYEMTKRRM
jgi:hypothetical protein